ncbi:DUF4097 family beta strand repeat protein [Paenibacillus sp. LMG 31456]|uniref:DUF4097 family beta strand repeat protein n=1 Tax=Paenibacillus foliorum TaxID=2654974 RepID=A0A972JYK5_9BACL|nr:DUF4097 family beta strand repeat-containing protein [Paenibacillus foliorum]NOU92646.1 DUF4097 family beta strand repeat protein [Paenibacillus foliorum]
MRKAGRYTAALLLVAVGAAVMTDQYSGTHWTSLLIDWWPVLFITLGLEYIAFNMKYGESDKQLRLDVGGVIFAVLISAVVIGSTQSTETIRSWFGNINLANHIGSAMSGEGHKFEKETVSIPIPAGLERISVNNHSNGNVTVKSGTSDQLLIDMTVYVTLGDEKEAASIADQTKLEHILDGDKLKLIAEGKEFGEGLPWMTQRPGIDLVITVPSRVQVSMDFDMSNGKFKAEQLTFRNELKVRTTNGEIQVASINGNLDLESTNAPIKAVKIKGNAQLETTNGSIEIEDHQGNARIISTNGRLRTAGVTGSIEAETTNGGIIVTDAPQGLKAHTTNGSVEVTSRIVNGDWDVETSHGKVTLKLPANGDYKIKGEGQNGDIHSSLPFQIRKNKIDGTIGNGRHGIRIETNGSLSIQTAD